MLEIVAPGLFSTVQDRGRLGFYSMGVPPSGAMDLFAHDVANILVGNESDAATIEATFLGPTITFRAFSVFAVTGAEVDLTLDGESIPQWMSYVARAGQTLQFSGMHAGARAYVAVRGGIDSPLLMGSRSTYTTSGLGGHEGRALQRGDLLPLGVMTRPGTKPAGGMKVPETLRPQYSSQQVIRVVPGLCDYRLTPESESAMYSTPYSITAESNRTGYRLVGHQLGFRDRVPPFGAGADPSNVVNLGYPVGSIQVPSGTELIALLRDAVTGGGYATVGTIISGDLDLIAQAKAPDTIVFEPVTIEQALLERGVWKRRLRRIFQSVE